jgi:sigma-B regulation protein RsbU (phosphoserine phosphatase)
MFVTLLYGELDLTNHTLTYVRAGHEYPLLWSASGAAMPVPQGQAHPLGLFPEPVLEARTLRLSPGSSLLFFSDGVTEAMDGEAELFGHARLEAAARSRAELGAQALCDHLAQTVERYRAGAAQMDDITLLAVRIAA